jgi:uncharacterized phage-associated protein
MVKDHMAISYDEAKFTEMLVYVADRLRDDRAGGATKLNKVLYFADFAHMRRTGRPITGAVYQRLPHGPAPRRLVPVRDRLVAAGEADIAAGQFLGFSQRRLVPTRAADLSVFSADELATIDAVLDDLAHLTATQVSALSHEEPGWRLAADGETISYASATIALRQVSTETAAALGRDVARRYGITASS